ncbi:MAG TPA: MFS transporter [Kofleriaceae bacterium]|nr:MFS transporter [Kofleriaceae bacterium]
MSRASGSASARAVFALLAAAAGLGAANLYYAQPLAEAMASDFHTTATGVSPALIGTQLGYAAGMLLLVPLGDVRERRGVMITTSLCAGLALLGFAVAPSLILLAVASVLVGLGASLAQMVVPFAVGLAPPDQRGKVVGNIMGGLLAGILLSRTASGKLGEMVGWRWVFVAAAGVMVALAGVLRVALPRVPPTTQLAYRDLLRSLVTIARREPLLRRRCLIGGLGFASFSVFWSTLAFHLKHTGLGGSAMAGKLGIIGLTGIVVAPIAGRLAMRVAPARVNLGALVLLVLSFAVFGAAPASLLAIGIGVVLLDAGTQANQLTNQTVIYGLAPDERSRINAIYMVSYFLGGAIGTAVAAQAWQRGGWPAVCIAGAAFSLLGMLPLLGERG